MTRRTLNSLIATLVLAAGAVPALAQGTAFTYQGELQSSGSPVNTPADFEFRLFTTATGGSQLGTSVVRTAVSVTSGLFNTPVDFGVNPYTSNQALFLEIAVRNPAGSGSFVTLGSRQALTPAPFSLATRGLNVNAAGDLSLLTGGDRRINVPSTPLNANGTNLIVTAGEANTSGNAADGGDLILEAGRARNADQSFVRPGDVIIRSGGNRDNSFNAPNGGDIIFQSGAAFSATAERMRITPAGNVGIGTATPPESLSVGNFGVSGAVDRYIQISTEGGNAHRAGLKLRHFNSNAGYTIESDERGLATGAFGFNIIDLNTGAGTTPASVFYIRKGTGSVGIGTLNPDQRLSVNGNASKTGGGSWAVLSDERTKNDIQPMTGTLDRLLQLKGHSYTYKPEFVQDGRALPGMQIGLVAQEVETVFPDWVTTGADGLKQVTERSTTALMVEALRDLRTEKDAQIAERDAELASLKARLEKLEAMLHAAAAK